MTDIVLPYYNNTSSITLNKNFNKDFILVSIKDNKNWAKRKRGNTIKEKPGN